MARIRYEENFGNGFGFLHGWTAIAQHLKKSIRTARRWYDKWNMPVRHSITGRPFALEHELDMWMMLVDEYLRKDMARQQQQREHAAMMRARKMEKRGTRENQNYRTNTRKGEIRTS